MIDGNRRIRLVWIVLFSCLLVFVFPNNSLQSATSKSSIENSIGDFFGLYLLNKERRSRLDSVTVKGNSRTGYTAELGYWRSLKSRDPVDEICNAYRWILFGRGTYGKGAAEAFKAYPGLKEVRFKFFDVEFTTKLGKKKAEVLPSQRVIPYLNIGVQERSLARKKPNWSSISDLLDKGKCAEVGKRYLDDTWFDEDYIRKAQ